jgi:hypothetical protein
MMFSYGKFFGQGRLFFDPERVTFNSRGQGRERETMNDERGIK